MGVTRMRRVRAAKKKETERALKWILLPPTVAGALLLGVGKKKKPRRKK
jgi:hypothetical protein